MFTYRRERSKGLPLQSSLIWCLCASLLWRTCSSKPLNPNHHCHLSRQEGLRHWSNSCHRKHLPSCHRVIRATSSRRRCFSSFLKTRRTSRFHPFSRRFSVRWKTPATPCCSHDCCLRCHLVESPRRSSL